MAKRNRNPVLKELKSILSGLGFETWWHGGLLGFAVGSYRYTVLFELADSYSLNYYSVKVLQIGVNKPLPMWLLCASSGAQLFIKMRNNRVFFNHQLTNVSAA